MDIQTIYAARNMPRPSLGEEILSIISKLKISFKPAFRRPFVPRKVVNDNWREAALIDAVRRVRVVDDVDYNEISSAMNKLSKANYTKLMTDVLERLKKRDETFRLRVTTLLFDRAVQQTFFASLMADVYKDIAASQPEALHDLATQTQMFEKLYNVDNVSVFPSTGDAGYDAAVIQWTKLKETKRGFAVYVAELYSRGLVPEDTMTGVLKTIMDELSSSIRTPKTAPIEEHVDALVRFLFAVATKVPLRVPLQAVLALPRGETPSLNMKNRFKIEDTIKISR